MIETVPLGQAAAAYAKTRSGKARVRMLLTMER
jgi:D-arabinose 1-dehydrogenase-like Zn-dependent alcohol dehydrogenase